VCPELSAWKSAPEMALLNRRMMEDLLEGGVGVAMLRKGASEGGGVQTLTSPRVFSESGESLALANLRFKAWANG
jgi:hypothetical protein